MQNEGVVLAGVGLLGICCLRRRKALFGALSALLLLAGLGLTTIGCSSPVASQYTVTLVSENGTKAVQGSTVQLQAGVTANVGGTVNSGIVTFYDGTTSLGAVSVSNGTVTLLNSSLAVGVHTIAAVYQDTRAVTAFSNAINQAVTGTFTVQVTATSGTLTHSTPLSFQLQ